MKTKIIPIILIISINLLFCGCFEQHNNMVSSPFIDTHEHYYGKVVKVVDGDTIYVEVNGHLWKIRLLGVDTPETYKKNNPDEYYLLNGTPITDINYLKYWGEKAKNFAKRELDHKEVIIVFDDEAPKKDKYGRYLAYIYINDSGKLENFNEELLKYGYARVYVSRFELEHEFLNIERKAKENRVGLWNWTNN